MIISRPDYLSRMSFEKQPYKKKCRTYFFASTIYIAHQYIVRTSTAWVNIYCWIYCRAYIFVARGSVLLSIYILSLHTYFFCCVHVFFCCMHIFFVEYIYFVVAYEYECCWILLPKNNHTLARCSESCWFMNRFVWHCAQHFICYSTEIVFGLTLIIRNW